jgi:hypothetical protein
VEHVTCKDYLSEDAKAKVKDFEKKLGECLDDSNFILQSEDGVDLKKLEDLDDDGVGAMVDDGITPTEEEYDGMILAEHPEADDEEAVDMYLNMGLFLMKSVTTACQMAALSLQIWVLALMTARSILKAYSTIRRTEVRRTKGTLRETLRKVLSPEWRGSGTCDTEGSCRSGTPTLTWVWALSPPFPPICLEVPCNADQCLHLLHQCNVLPLMFCFVSGSPDLGSISFQLFWVSTFPASCWCCRLPSLLLLFLSTWGSLDSNV